MLVTFLRSGVDLVPRGRVKGVKDQPLSLLSGEIDSYLKFRVQGLPPRVLKATLTLTEHGDNGSGTLRVLRGSHSDWTAATLSKATAPAHGDEVGKHTGSVDEGETITISVTPLVTGNGTYTAILVLAQGGNDIWFGSSESTVKPELTVTAEDPEAR